MMTRKRRHSGFTLVELAVVLVIMALLASTVALSSGGLLHGATLAETAAQIESLDREARALAKRLDRSIQLQVDTSEQRLVLLDPQQPNEPSLGGYAMPSGYQLDVAWRLRRGEHEESDRVVVHYEPDGTSTTWGLVLRSPGEETKTRTLMVLGMTGQFTTWETHGQAQDILAAAQRHDAD